MRQERPVVWKSNWEWFAWVCELCVCVGWGLREYQGGANNVSQLAGDSDMVSACWLYVRGFSEKEQWPLPALVSGADPQLFP